MPNIEQRSSSIDAQFALLEATATCLQQERADRVRDVLMVARDLEARLQLPVAKLLLEVKQGRYWASWSFSSFRAFVETDCHFSLRKAQELMRVYAKLVVELGIAPACIERLGWSKVALCAARITPANLEVMLAEIEQKSFSELQASYKRTPKRAAKLNRPDGSKHLRITPAIQDALQRAATVTGSVDLQVNLEFVACRFVEAHCEFSRLSRPGLN